MSGLLSLTFEKWKAHPRRYDVPFLIQTSYRQYLDRRLMEKLRRRVLVPPIDPVNVEILADEDFRASVAAVRGRTLLDVGRLANLWNLARQAGPGVYLEVGSYRGGGALHICNAVRERNPRFYSFDPFEDGGFENIRPEDQLFSKDQFTETSYREVVRLLSSHPNATVKKGFFPAAAEGLDLQPIAFCHLDVDVYEATCECLNFIAPRLGPRSFIVLDDINRNVKGVERAVQEFLAANPSFLMIPLFPSQGLLLSTKCWEASA
jgi:O-methyltransferase